jgi:hypothetical protein
MPADRSNGDGSDEYTKCSTTESVRKASWTQSHAREVKIVCCIASMITYVADNHRKRHLNQLLVKHYSGLATLMKARILRLRIINVPVFSLERKDLNDLLNDYEIRNG